MARWGKTKCGCMITVIGTEPGDIPRARLDFCPLHKHAGRLKEASRHLYMVIYEQIPAITTSKKFQKALDRFWRALNASMEKAKP